MNNDYHASVMALYDQPWRHYHNAQHIADVHMYVQALKAIYGVCPTDPFALNRAIDLHDVIYVPGKKGSEEASAMLADSYNSAEVGRLIRLTEFHEPVLPSDDLDGCFIVDADLYGLAMPWDEYEANAAAIKSEYAAFNSGRVYGPGFDKLWRAGRSKFLRDFLDRKTIFHGPNTRHLNDAARTNIARELGNFTKSGCNHVYGMGIACTRCGATI